MAGEQRISAAEAAARLGIKRESLYAYVSRGLLESRTLDGKTSTFDPAEVEALQRRRRGPRTSAAGVPIVSAITRIEGSAISYRGEPLDGLVARRVPFESVAALLWDAAPDDASLSWRPDPALLQRTVAVQRALPERTPTLDRLRATVVCASATDVLRGDLRPRSIVRSAAALIGLMVDALPGADPDRGSIAERLWPALTDLRATAKWRQVVDTALVVLADHDLASSTFAVRVAASARADVYSMVSAGLGAFGGALHGGASRPLHDVFRTAIDDGPEAAVAHVLRPDGPVSGFGHGLYPDGDPRVGLLLPLVFEAAGAPRRVERVRAAIDLLQERLGLAPNVDCALAAMSALAGMDADVNGVFAVARTAGWVAHGLAELDERPLRFRPSSRWVG